MNKRTMQVYTLLMMGFGILSIQCNGDMESSPTPPTICRDQDLDGYYPESCGGDDCNDADAAIHPINLELCDGIDNNCNGQLDDVLDTDGDGYFTCDADATRIDCNDFDESVYPGAEESVSAGGAPLQDSNCDGIVQVLVNPAEGLPATTWQVPEVGDMQLSFPGESLEVAPEDCLNVGTDGACQQVQLTLSSPSSNNTRTASAEPTSEDLLLFSKPFHISPAMTFKAGPANVTLQLNAVPEGQTSVCNGSGLSKVIPSGEVYAPAGQFIPASDCNEAEKTITVEADELEETEYAGAGSSDLSQSFYELEPTSAVGIRVTDGMPFTLQWNLTQNNVTYGNSKSLFAIIEYDDVGTLVVPSGPLQYVKSTALYELNGIKMSTELQTAPEREVLVWLRDKSLDNEPWTATHCSKRIKQAVVDAGLAVEVDCTKESQEAICLDFVKEEGSHPYLYDCATVTLTPVNRYYLDQDGDTYGTETYKDMTSPDAVYRASRTGDCDDVRQDVNPDASEVCNGLDDNCKGGVDEGLPTFPYYKDVDGDGFGASASGTIQRCSRPDGYADNDSDCNDKSATIHPNAKEVCNGSDDDCDGEKDEDVLLTWYLDADGDGYGIDAVTTRACQQPTGYASEAGDCNDDPKTGASIHPGAPEICDSIDNNCLNGVDEGIVKDPWYRDADGDTYGDAHVKVVTCAQPDGYVSDSLDCDDDDALVSPDQTEACNGVDDNCNGELDDGYSTIRYYEDADHDSYGNALEYVDACLQPTGYVKDNKDCNDDPVTGSVINPGATESCNGVDDNCSGKVDEDVITTYYKDNDTDGFGSSASGTAQACSAPTGYYASNTDCNDANAAVSPAAIELCNGVDDDCKNGIDDGVKTTFYKDNDGDTFGSSLSGTTEACIMPTGYSASNTDCNDASATVKPGATETCNSKDDNCNGTTDEGVTTTFYKDNDGDGYGSATSGTTQACTRPTGYSTTSTDCNDADAASNPGAAEQCNSKDDNCNGQIDEGVTTSTWYKDNDGDGYGATASGTTNNCAKPTGYSALSTDCNDANGAVNPGATETCNGIDDNCNGTTDEGVTTTFYKDNDGDGYGSATSGTTQACTRPTGYSTTSTDCNDADAAINPGAAEQCNSKDDNCNLTVDENVKTTFYQDVDGDGYGNVLNTTQACVAPTGYVSNSTDCNDADKNINPAATEVCDSKDNDCDKLVDDADPSTADKRTWYQDADNDGYGNALTSTKACSKPSGYVADNTDCNDSNSSVNPGATELCDGVDNDCDKLVDDADPSTANKGTWYQDADNDGFGGGLSKTACQQPSGYVGSNTDCNDSNSSVNPGATELCDGVDNDCDKLVDDADSSTVEQPTWYRDQDSDAYPSKASSSIRCVQPSGYIPARSDGKWDCVDTNAAINPGAQESCNGIDDNCNNQIDEGVTTTYYRDVDGDGCGSSSSGTISACSLPSGYSTCSSDCNDANAAIYPGAFERCNGVDDNCNGSIDDGLAFSTWYKDNDGDGYGAASSGSQSACSQPAGYVSNNSDCNDASASVHPGATETCNSVDDNCDGQIDEGLTLYTYYRDSDGDGYGRTSKQACSKPSGYVTKSGDCDDNNASVHPGATETCNSVDDNCDDRVDEGVTTTYYKDADNDGYGTSGSTTQACSKPTGYSTVGTDCNDADATINPGKAEVCNSKDDNCNSTVDEGLTTTYYRDADGDGYGNSTITTQACSAPSGYVSNSSDCNDTSASIKPSATETCNGVDDDCDGSVDDGVGTTYYRDADGDTYGTSGTKTIACSQPTGYVTNSSDCYDSNRNAKPGQTSYFTINRGDGSFDYDCNGTDDQRYKIDNVICQESCPSAGWAGMSIPACGNSAAWKNCSGNLQSCSTSTYTETQQCR